MDCGRPKVASFKSLSIIQAVKEFGSFPISPLFVPVASSEMERGIKSPRSLSSNQQPFSSREPGRREMIIFRRAAGRYQFFFFLLWEV